jgi:hypothetical protein
MTWNDEDFAEELSSSKEEINEGYYCPFCKKNTDIWFDRTITTWHDEKGNRYEEGMKDRCTGCGRATDEVPEEEDDYTYDVENDGG